MWKKLLVLFFVVLMLLIPSVIALADIDLKIRDTNCDNKLCGELDNQLTSEHLKCLIGSVSFVRDSERRQIVFDIIHEILMRGNVDNIDIQKIVEKYDTDITSSYILSKIKTTGHSGNCDGFVFCFPGFIRSLFGGLILIRPIAVIYAKYSYLSSFDGFGWHFTINGEEVSSGSGHIIGYTGRVNLALPYGPSDWYFMLDGIAVLVLHEAN